MTPLIHVSSLTFMLRKNFEETYLMALMLAKCLILASLRSPGLGYSIIITAESADQRSEFYHADIYIPVGCSNAKYR